MIITAYGRMSIEHDTYKLLKEASMNHVLISITSNMKHAVDLQYVYKCPYCKSVLTNYFEDMDSIDYKGSIILVALVVSYLTIPHVEFWIGLFCIVWMLGCGSVGWNLANVI